MECQKTLIAQHLKEATKNLFEKETLYRETQKVRDEMMRTHRLYLDGEILLKDSASSTSQPKNA